MSSQKSVEYSDARGLGIFNQRPAPLLVRNTSGPVGYIRWDGNAVKVLQQMVQHLDWDESDSVGLSRSEPGQGPKFGALSSVALVLHGSNRGSSPLGDAIGFSGLGVN